MIKWFVYIVLLLILIPWLSSAELKTDHKAPVSTRGDIRSYLSKSVPVDTTSKTKQKKQQDQDDKKKIKEVTKAKRLPKPEKLDENADPNSPKKVKPKRERRPPGLERPPEIPRRNGN